MFLHADPQSWRDLTGGLPRPRCVACAFVSSAEKRALNEPVSRPLLAVRTSGASAASSLLRPSSSRCASAPLTSMPIHTNELSVVDCPLEYVEVNVEVVGVVLAYNWARAYPSCHSAS
jgi:hypothetical protein